LEKKTNYFLNLEKFNYSRKSVNEINSSQGLSFTNQHGILNVLQLFSKIW